MKMQRITPAMLSFLLLTACVTINIYFPSAQAQEAAEKIVDDILGKAGAQVPAPKPEAAPAAQPQSLNAVERGLSAVLDFFIPSAHAAGPDFSVDTLEIRTLQAEMKKRHGSLEPFYANGAIGFTRDALVGMHDDGAVSLKERGSLNKLIQAENANRNQLYKAIAAANGHPEWEPQVRDVFAGTWIDKASKDWWYQNSGGAWTQK